MKHGLFITDVSIENKIKTNGVAKKIVSQVGALNIKGEMTCQLFCLPRLSISRPFLFFSYLFLDIYKKIYSEICSYDFIYIRRIIPANKGLISLLKTIKKNNPGCKIVYELPTYPYDKEHKTTVSKLALFIDKVFRRQLKKYIDKIVTLSNDDIIFGVSTIKTMNGINCADIQMRTPISSQDRINLIAVAQFTRSHGYDRLIEGLNKYYEKNETSRRLYIHFVGDGPEVNALRQMTHQYNLSENIIFHGALFGKELADIFNKADIAVSSLGCHRTGVFIGSFLKTREYLARGIPMISSTKIDVLPSGFEYCLYVPEDESPVDIQAILDFYHDLMTKYSVSEMIKDIRKFAEDNCDISKTMRTVIECLM